MKYDTQFWEFLQKLTDENEIIIDRPKGTKHPKYENITYEIDYGYINNTNSMDGGGIDVFKGSLNNKSADTILCTIDLLKKDSEIKILIGCTEIEKIKAYNQLNNSEYMKAVMIKKEVLNNNIEKEIIEINTGYSFNEIYEVFEDIIYKPTEEKVKEILSGYKNSEEKTLFGYIVNKKLIGLIGIKNYPEHIEILHFGIHPQYRSRHFGTELMDYIKEINKRMILTTYDGAVMFYKNYGYKYSEYYEEKGGEKYKRYKCEYN
jgi:inorganic pyrophosphatase